MYFLATHPKKSAPQTIMSPDCFTYQQTDSKSITFSCGYTAEEPDFPTFNYRRTLFRYSYSITTISKKYFPIPTLPFKMVFKILLQLESTLGPTGRRAHQVFGVWGQILSTILDHHRSKRAGSILHGVRNLIFPEKCLPWGKSHRVAGK